MTVKMSGSEFKRFYNDPKIWPDDVWHEDTEMSVDGVDQPDGIDDEALSDTAVVSISGGTVYGPQWDGDNPSLETYFKRWRKAQALTFFTVECDKADLDAVKAAIIAAGGKVIK